MTSRSLRRWTVSLTCAAAAVALVSATGPLMADHEARVGPYAERANMP